MVADHELPEIKVSDRVAGDSFGPSCSAEGGREGVRLASAVAASALLVGAAFTSAPAPAASATRSPQMCHQGVVRAARVPSAGLCSQNDRDSGLAVSSQHFGAEFDALDDQGADDFGAA